MAKQDTEIQLKLKLQAESAKVQIKKLKKDLEDLDGRTSEYNETVAKLNVQKRKLKDTQDKLSQSYKKSKKPIESNTIAHKNSEKAIQDEIKRLNQLKSTLDITSKEYIQASTDVKVLQGRLSQLKSSTGNTTNAVLELGRVVQDAPYGIRGMGNNITQLVTSLSFATKEAGGLTKALKGMWSALMGPLGIVLAISAVISYFDFMSDKAEDATESIDGLDKALANLTAKKAEVEILALTFKTANTESDLYLGTLKRLKDLGFDPLTQSVDEFKESFIEMITLQANRKYLEEQLNSLAEQRIALDRQRKKAIEEGVGTFTVGASAFGKGETVTITEDDIVRKFKERYDEIDEQLKKYAVDFRETTNKINEILGGKVEMTDPDIEFSLGVGADYGFEDFKDPVSVLREVLSQDFGPDVDPDDVYMGFIEQYEFDEQLALLQSFIDAKKAKLQQDYQNELDAFNNRQEIYQLTAGLFTALGSAMEKGTQEQKALLSAGALMNGFASINQIWSKSFSPFGPDDIAQKVIASAMVGAKTFANVKAINAVNVGGRSSGGRGSSGQGGREFDFNLVGSTGNNQLAQAVGGQFQDQTVRAYVVGSDITNRQQLDNKIKTTATFGSD